MMKLKQFKSWFKKAYPDIEIRIFENNLYSINREKNSAVIKDFGDHIKVIVDNDIYIDELEIVKKCKSLYGYSQCPYKYHIKTYELKEFPTKVIAGKYGLLTYLEETYGSRIKYENHKYNVRIIIDNYLEGPLLCNSGIQPDPKSTLTPIIKYTEKDKILSIFDALLL